MRAFLSGRFFPVICLATASLFSCGSKNHKSGGGVPGTKVEEAFLKAAADNNIPVRLLMASGYLESGLRSSRSSVGYQVDGGQVSRSPARGESSFGFSMAELGLPPDAGLEAQIAAYAKLVRSRISGGSLPDKAVTSEDKIKWIWKLAAVHRGEQASRNLLAVYSREIMAILNNGFVVQDGDGLVAKLDKEGAPLREQDLAENYRQDLQLDMYHSDIRSGYLFSLTRSQQSDVVNHPKRIEVVHCPFALSTCIQMQDESSADVARFGAHYMIPASDSLVPGIIQFAHHDESVSLTNSAGQLEVVGDRIVVMLAGLSGRYVNGRRDYADPMWMSDFQLRLLGAAVSEICAAISRSEGVNREQCQTVGGASGILFRTQPAETFRWGDIADFDETIFTPYLASAEGISASTTLTHSGDGPINAGSVFHLNAGFQATARRIELERLVRCPGADRRVIWEPVDQQQVRQTSSISFEKRWYDAGPNGTGDQFFRVKANGEGGKFLGWATKRVQLKGFDKNDVPVAPSKYCLRNGSKLRPQQVL